MRLWGPLPSAVVVGLACAAAVAGTDALDADVREYVVPTPDALPHDPAVGPDGALWFTEERANKIGRLDPVTGHFREYPLKTPASGPHGLVADRQGKIWFTANTAAYVGALDPSTGVVKEFHWKDGRVKDPHTPVFDDTGVLWFTAEESNVIGLLDPKTAAVRFLDVPTRRAQPYGIAPAPDGALYFCEFGTNKIGRVDRRSMRIREYPLTEGARPRRLAIAADGTIFYSDYERGFLGHLDPATGKVDEWPCPSGSDARPYGIAAAPDGEIWLSESGVMPNTLVRFDPRSNRFATAPIPSGGGVVRNLAITSDGRVYLACSGMNRVAIATPRSAHAGR